MKRNFLKAAAVVFCSAAAVFSSCKKDNASTGDITTENEALPVTDQLDVTTDIKAVVLGDARSDFNASVVNRLKNQTNEISADAGVIVFTSGYAVNPTREQMELLLEAYANGAAFIFTNPRFPDISGLETLVWDSFNALIEEGKLSDVETAANFIGRVKTVKDLCDNKRCGAVEGVAFRGESVYLVRDLDETADFSDLNSSGFYSDGKTSKEFTCVDTDYVPTAYDHGKSADLLIRWIEDGREESRSLFNAAAFGLKGDATDAIDKYMAGQRVSIQHKVGPSRALDRTLIYEMVYTVYSAYDFDKNEDYYFIRLEPNFHCSALGCQNGATSWVKGTHEVTFDDGTTAGHWSSSRDNKWYGPYMSKFDYTAYVVYANGDQVSGTTLLSTTPHTDVSGSTGYSTGISWSLSGNVGFNSGGIMGGVTGGVTFSDTRSHSESDLKVYHKMQNDVPNWRIAGIVPQFHPSWNPYHDEVATFQKTDWQTEFTWIVKVANPQKDKAYYAKGVDVTEITELNYSFYDLELSVHPTQSAMISLCTPNRSRLGFTMTCSDQNLRDEISKQFSQTWQNEFTYYATDDNASLTGAKAMFEKVKVAVKGYAETLKDYGFTGTYTFRLNKTDGTKIAEFTLENGSVK